MILTKQVADPGTPLIRRNFFMASGYAGPSGESAGSHLDSSCYYLDPAALRAAAGWEQGEGRWPERVEKKSCYVASARRVLLMF